MKYITLLFLGCLLAAGCTIINPKERTPTYFHIDSFAFTPANPLLGSTSHRITSVFVYYNSYTVGVYDLPATFPVLTNGTSGILELAPGISKNESSDFQVPYPFYALDTFTFSPNPGTVIQRAPTTTYNSNTSAIIIDDFESSTPRWGKVSGSVGITRSTDTTLGIEGVGSGLISLASTTDSSTDSTILTFNTPLGDAYFEFDYKCTAPFAVGLQGNLGGITSTPYYLVGLNPSSTWQKCYLYFGDYVQAFGPTTIKLYINTVSPGVPNTYVLIDNVKLVTH